MNEIKNEEKKFENREINNRKEFAELSKYSKKLSPEAAKQKETESKSELLKIIIQNHAENREKTAKEITQQPSNQKYLDSYRSLLGEISSHQKKAREYRSEARKLESDIQRRSVGFRKQSDVAMLEKQAKAEDAIVRNLEREKRGLASLITHTPESGSEEDKQMKKEIRNPSIHELPTSMETSNSLRHINRPETERIRRTPDDVKREMKGILERNRAEHPVDREIHTREIYKPEPKHLSFHGGLGAKEISHINGTWKLNDANRKRSEASSCESAAHSASVLGQHGKASELESRAKALKQEAVRLEAEGKRLLAYKSKSK